MAARTSIVFLVTFAAVATGAPQQNAATPVSRPQIRGVVLEPGTNQPIVDAEIFLFVQEPGPVRLNGGWKADPRRAKTDFAGWFTLSLDKPGSYRVEAMKPDYFAPAARATPSSLEVALTSEKPVAEARLYLSRPGRVTGRVVDEETGEALANFRVTVVRVNDRGGFPPDGPPATTDAHGQFAASGLAPGGYAVEIRPQTAPEKRVLTQFKDGDAAAEERDYEHTYWPGGQGAEGALPVTVASGATVDIGKLSLRKVPYYRARVRVQASTCEDADEIQVIESIRTARGATVHPLTVVPCGKDLLVTGFAPGSYRLLLSQKGRTWETRATASVVFSIIDRSIEVNAPLALGVNLEGAFVAAAGAALPDLTRAAVLLTAMDSVAFMNEIPRVSPAPDGTFRISGARLVEQMVYVSGLGPGHYVKEFRYNGVALESDVVPLASGAMAHMLTIVVDDKPGTITGSVMAGDQPVRRPVVLARKWPPSKVPTASGNAGVMGDDAGRFRLAGLAPGEYHVIALRAIDPSTSELGLERALAAATKVEVGSNGIQNVTLEITDVR